MAIPHVRTAYLCPASRRSAFHYVCECTFVSRKEGQGKLSINLRLCDDASGSASSYFLLHTFDGDEMNDAVLGVHYSRHFRSLSFVGERRTRVIEFIVGLGCIVVQCEMIAVRHSAVPRKGLVFPLHGPGERLRLGLWLGVLPGSVRSQSFAVFL